MIYCGKAEFGQVPRSFASNSGAILLKRPKNLTQICFPSLRSVKSDRLLGFLDYQGTIFTINFDGVTGHKLAGKYAFSKGIFQHMLNCPF